MAPLAQIMQRQGYHVAGSDRAHDQGQTPEKFKSLKKSGIRLFPQDGSAIGSHIKQLVASAAVEDQIPDVQAAKSQNISVIKRAELLAQLVNKAETGIAIAGTSGKSTVTGMCAVILEDAKFEPTVINGGIIKNFGAAMRPGRSEICLAEADESDGSIALYNPSHAVLTNISHDHHDMDTLKGYFYAFMDRASEAVILNVDDPVLRDYTRQGGRQNINTFALDNRSADFYAENIKPLADGVSFNVRGRQITLPVPGRHNVANALAALALADSMNIEMGIACAAIQKFQGIKRRLETVGKTKAGVIVIDDFAHNPDKIAASLQTLKTYPGRLLVFFQPHGYGPMRLMGTDIAESFKRFFDAKDCLFMSEPFYAGGTTEKDDASARCVENIKDSGLNARLVTDRQDFAQVLQEQGREGDRAVIMGARDDTLSEFARDMLTF